MARERSLQSEYGLLVVGRWQLVGQGGRLERGGALEDTFERNTTRRDADKKKGKERSVVRDVLIDRERKKEREREREGITSLRV